MRAVVFKDAHVALGVAAKMMMGHPAFAALPFGEWTSVMVGQIGRGHIRFFLDEHDAVRGLLGWAFTDRAHAEAWAHAGASLHDRDCRGGECMVINVWVADTDGVTRAMLDEARRIWSGKTALFYKRFYADGRVRPVRLPIASFPLDRAA